MFCPVCKAEYRLGFTHCPDCDVDLVENLDDAPSASSQDSDTPYALWSGTDSAAQSALCDALDSAHVPYHKRERNVGILLDFTQPVYAILVHGRDRDAAQAVLEDVRRRAEAGELSKSSDATEQLPEDDGEPEEEEGQTPAPDDIAEDFHPEDATSETWAGATVEMAELVRLCLRENGIGCVVDNSDGTQRVRVLPASEARAKEIVREISEGTPPE
ncbi:MAG TPA: hypothetical protein VLY23_06540 [Candidatus Acidoferrum sp.]|nr:hypothetical protein [Candidatus Acidoferrum sp.]